MDEALYKGGTLTSIFTSQNIPRIVIVTNKDGVEIGLGIDLCVLQAICYCNAHIANPTKKQVVLGSYYSEQSNEPLNIWLNTKSIIASAKDNYIHCVISDTEKNIQYHGATPSLLPAISEAFNNPRLKRID